MEIALINIDDQRIVQIPINQICPNPYQPRKAFDRRSLEELAESIRQFGVIQPISVRKTDDRYELVAGERRLRASKMAGMDSIPAIISVICEKDSAFIALMENLQRENLNYMEEADGYINLMKNYGMTQEDVAAKLGKSQSGIANKIRLLKLPDSVKAILRENSLTERHARALLKLPNEETQLKVLNEIITKRLNVQMTEQYIEGIQGNLYGQSSGEDHDLIDLITENKNNKIKKNTAKRYKIYIRDSRVYINTIKKAVELILQSGGDASYKIHELTDTVEVVVVIRKG